MFSHGAYSARETNSLPQTSIQRCLEYLRFTEGGGKLSDEEDSWQGCSPILPRQHFDNHLVGDLPSSCCHIVWWTHSWVGRLQAIPKKIYMQAINCPKRMVFLSSPLGKGRRQTWELELALQHFGGHTNDLLLHWEECFNYKKLSRWRWYHRSSAGRRFGNWTLMMYQVPQCREAIWETEVISKYLSCDSSWQWSSRYVWSV